MLASDMIGDIITYRVLSFPKSFHVRLPTLKLDVRS